MRASMVSLWIALAVASLASPVSAQETDAKEPAAAAKPAKSDDALSPSTLPTARRGVKETSTNRVDALSPDEARRLERIRAKAAGARPQSTQPQPATEASKQQPPAAEKPRYAEPAHDKAVPQPTGSVAKAAERDSVADAKPAIAAKPSPARAPRQANRRVRRPARETADVDLRRPRLRDYSAPRRGWPEVADRAPRVGDVVPYDAPLYPPPGYGRNYPRYPDDGGYPPPPGYGRRWWP